MTVKKLSALHRQILLPNVRRAQARLQTMGGRSRFAIFTLLSWEPELCVCDLADVLGMETSAVSQQLRVLRRTGLVRTRKLANLVLYRLALPKLGRLIHSLTSTHL